MNSNNGFLRKLIFFILLVIFVWIVVVHFGQTKQIIDVLYSGKWYWIFFAIVCQLFYYPFYARYIEYVFDIFGARMGRKDLLKVYLASKFTDVALPVATFGEIIIFVRNGKRHNVSPLNVGIGISFVLLFDVVAFVLLAGIVLLVLAVLGKSLTFLFVTYLILGVMVSVLILFLLQLAILKTPPNLVVLWVIKYITKLTRKNPIDIKDIEKVFLEIGSYLVRAGKKILNAFKLALEAQILNLLTFLFMYLAFAGHFDVLAIIAGYVAGLLFTIVSITPQGVGVAEAVIVATLHSFGLDISTAAVITLAYRGLLYWLPLFVGFYFFSRLELKKD